MTCYAHPHPLLQAAAEAARAARQNGAVDEEEDSEESSSDDDEEDLDADDDTDKVSSRGSMLAGLSVTCRPGITTLYFLCRSNPDGRASLRVALLHLQCSSLGCATKAAQVTLTQ